MSMQGTIQSFLKFNHFAVVGASSDPTKVSGKRKKKEKGKRKKEKGKRKKERKRRKRRKERKEGKERKKGKETVMNLQSGTLDPIRILNKAHEHRNLECWWLIF